MTRNMHVYSKFTDMFKYNIKGTVLRNLFLLLTLMTLGATNALAQSSHPKAGIWYMKNIKDASNVYYVVPAKDPQITAANHVNEDAYFSEDYSKSDGDPEKPFITTYKTGDDASAIWHFIPVSGEDNYYYIVHAVTGKYMKYQPYLTGSNLRRKFVHLEDIEKPSDTEKFQVTDYDTGVKIKPKNHDYYLNIAGENQDRYNGGASNPYYSGIIGGMSGYDKGSKFVLADVSSQVCATPTITYNESNGEVSISTTTGGATIYYTLDGTTPTTSSTAYNGSFTVSSSAKIQAIAVKADMLNSLVASMQVVKYTYFIVNSAKNIAVQYTIPYPVFPGAPLSGYASIPTEIQSQYLSDETITFYTMEGDFDADNLDYEHKIEVTPANNANIYVTYTTGKLGDKFLHLQGARPFNLKNSSNQYFVNSSSTDLTYDEINTETTPNVQNKNKDHIWYISGGDPYAVTITCSETNNYLTSSTSSVSSTTNTFILKSEAGTTVTFQDASGNIAVTINEVNIPTSYYLIDKVGKRLLGPVESTSSSITIPSEWYSPLAVYHYWKSSSFDEAGDVYTLKDGQTELSGLENLGTGEHIYVTYDVKNDIDLDGRNLLKVADKVGKTYRLQFAGGESFKQEDGLDGVMTETRKAVYPYSNGDASLYVYGNERWEEQLASGASTRTRWLWYLEPTEGVLDPYHVKVSSYQAQTNYKYKVTEGGKEVEKTLDYHSYLKTYKPEGHNAIVTGVTNDNPAVTGGGEGDDADNSDATEYMLLGTSLASLKLVTVEAISDGTTTERRTVNSFEQYWKNNPTVQGKLSESKKVSTVGRDVKLSDAQKSEITGLGWHVYAEWANSAPWVHNNDGGGGKAHTTSKKFKKEEHVYQTINMGETFQLIETEIKPMLILLDQHGWEIVRLPLPSGDPLTLTPAQQIERKNAYANLHKYSSPMVECYRFWKTGDKVPGYHKYKVSDPATNTDGSVFTTDELGRADITNPSTPPNLPDYQTQALVGGKERDWYVTYDVKDEYANRYPAAATKPESSVPYLIKQNGVYAQYSGSGTSISTTDTEPDIMNVPVGMQWYLMRNFDIDAEMGYLYLGEDGAQEDAKSKADTELDYFDHTREGAVPTWSNGFDPYNIQIKSAVPGTDRYFTANTTGSAVTSFWGGSSSSISLQNMGVGQPGVRGLDQTKMKITNATFMVVDDGNGNMRLMPRFDNTKVMQNFTALAAQAAAADKEDKGTGIQTLYLTAVPKVVNKSADINAMGGYYILSYPFTASGSIGTKAAPFKGTIEGQINQSFSVSAPFIAYADGAVIKNVIIESAGVSSGESAVVVDETDKTALGAICNVAQGNTRIYNCGINGGSVGASADYVGGIVGLLDDYSRVINCYSYATIEGGSDVGGIVGYNDYASTAANIRTMVMNCMFYGNITGGTNKSPVYGGYNIANLQGGLNTFNYYAYQNLPTGNITKYNGALAIEDKFLNRFEYYRLLLNSNKKLAAFYATGSADDADRKMAKWVLETADRTIDNPKPYPVLKAQGYYPSIINYDTRDLANYSEENRNQGLKTGTLSVTVSGVGSNAPSGASITTGSLTLTRTDKDFDHFNFNYDKVQLPYYNDVGEGNYTENKVVTGWKITAITAVDGDPYTAANYPTTGVKDFPDHNYADRKSSNKDLYDVSKRVFSQGAYFDVPYGVESITIEPYWANAIYVADANYDVVYKADYSGKQNVTQTGTQAVDNTTTFNGQKIRTSITGLSSGTTVYDNAVVLVGNFHLDNVPTGANGTTPFTMMSVDQDNDHEPDYSLIYHHKNRTAICPIRFDFLNIPGTAQAQKPNGASLICNFTIFKTKGWFEVTNTSSFYTSQVEYENQDGVSKTDAPLILQGGVIDQFVSTQSKTVPGKTIYIHLGGNVWIKEFGMGTHSDGSESTPHVPVSVTGGEYEGFYLTGTYNANAKISSDNAECYISGGYFHEVAGASLEQIDGSVHWQIYNADIDEFFGGGINEAKPIKGDVTTDIYNSHVTLFCGGPKFGNMQKDKTVTTTAEGCTFGKFFGAGYGGTSIAKKKYYDKDGSQNWTTLQGYYTTDRGKYFDGNSTGSSQISGKDYGKKGLGVATDFDYEFFVWSSGSTGARLFVKFASFSLAQCNDVNSNLTNCTINQDFYGGGSLGKVVGKATSVLDGCTVHGNVFGGGYSASLPPIQVRNAGFTTNPNYNSSSGMFEPGVFSGTTEFTWENAAKAGKTLTNGQSGSDLTNHYVYTNADLTALGQVGETDLTVKGNTTVEGSVFGGGDESSISASATATGDTKVTIEKNNDNETPTISNVYGGGNTADVDGNTKVEMTNGTVSQDIFGGGKGQTTVVGGNVEVNIGPKGYADKPLSVRNVYGGSAFGAVNATKDPSTGDLTLTAGKTTTVNIYAGTVDGSVFGGGLGYDDEDEAKDIVARNFGTTTVNMEGGQVKTAVYGGAYIYGVLKGDVDVNVLGGTVNTAPASTPTSASDIKNVVFGGGYGEPTIVEGDIAVTIGTQAATPDNSNPTVYGNVYGGSALGKVQVNEADEDQLTKEIVVNLYGGTIQGNVFGGGLGRKAAAAVGVEGTPGYVAAVTDVEARVGGNVNVLLDGAKFDCKYTGEGDNRMPLTGQVFGANNLNGTPKGHVKVHVKRTVDSAKPTDDGAVPTPNPIGRDDRTTYDVAAVYGGGNQADYVPTKATGSDADKEEAFAEVIIEGCELTSIEYVYGGGNAAAVPATDVTILGDYIIDYVFGGGNGKSTATFTNPGANVGSYNNGATDYGTGKAVTKLVGGYIMNVFGGSNTKGNVRGGTTITMPDKASYVAEGLSCCAVRDIKNIYGAGNEADQDGTVTLIVGCVDNMDYVYGGARNANVKGGVDLVVTSGHFKGVFGGNDQSGTIQGPITVTIEETGCDPLEIDNLYLGGNLAAYSIYGYKQDGENLVARTSISDGVAVNPPASNYSETQLYRDPILNVVSCTSIGNVFGGGYGTTATMYGSPTVNINMIPGKYGADTNSDGEPDALGTIGNVYGGGEEANIEGNTAVNICTVEKMAHRTSMGTELAEGDRVQKDVLPAIITNNVFGAGKGLADNVNSALVTGNTTITMAKGSVTKSVYGGGELSQVGGNTTIIISGGTIGKDREETATPGEYTYYGGAEYGNVFGGGLGNEAEGADVKFGLVKGNTNITIQNTVADAAWVEAHPDAGRAVGDVLSSPTIYHNVYGGGAMGSVGTYTYDGSGNITEHPAGDNGKATITITGGTIGTDGHNNGMVFGSSRGEIDDPASTHDKLAWVYDTEVTIGTNGAATGPTIHGSLYGGGENGHVYHDAAVIMYSGTVGNPSEYYAYRGNVYGAGCGTDMYYSMGTERHDGNGDKYNPSAGIVRGNATVTINGGSVANNIYGAGSMGKVEGSTSVTINTEGSVGVDGNHDDGNVYGAARGELDLTGNIPDGDDVHDYSTVKESTVTLTKGTVKGSVYGGGKAGVVTGQVTVQLNGGTVLHDVYGGGALAETNTLYDSGSAPANTYVTNVTLAGTTVSGNLYGGGLGRLAVAGQAAVPAVLYADVEEYNGAKGTSLTADQFAALTTEEKTKTPAVEAVEAASAVAADVNGPVKVVATAGSAANLFGGNNINGTPKSTIEVEIGTRTGASAPYTYGGTATISGSVYGGGNQAAYSGNPTVKLYGGMVNTNVYGGGLGSTAKITGNTSVSIEGGKVGNDVYGGGSQANVTGSVHVIVAGGEVVNDVYGGGALANTNTDNWDVSRLTTTYEKITATLTAGTSVVAGLYKKVDTNYVLQPANATAENAAEYYRRFDTAWAEGKTSASNTTTVTLTGGKIGNVFGGGLGNAETAVYVYGDVTINVNKSADITSYGGTGATFTRELAHNVVVEGKNYPSVPTTGNIFGANNFNGSPKGNITVEVFATKRVDGAAHVLGDYEIQGVYGGGNLASYLPATDKDTKVIVHGCDNTSIEYVYGGGNSASVPSTDVTIFGAFDIGYAFGGGNGSKPVKNSSGTWIANGGAMVTGDAKISAKGGRIGQVFGGSDAKGDILGTSTTDTSGAGGECGLTLTRLFGAGNEADVAGDVNMILSGCGTADAVQFVHGGSYNAHIAGDVNLTITSGYYTNVFGGNDARGSIGGKITVNIEETDECKPIVIHNLVGGGNMAPYPGTKKDGTEYPDNHPSKVTVNIKSATRIDNVYGGGLKADVKGDTEVNINMRKGSMANSLLSRPASYTGDVIPNVHVKNDGYTYINDTIGTIGNVFGGGNEGNVIGHTTVNIGTADSVAILRRTVPGGAFITAAPKNDSVYNYQGKLIYDEIAGDKVARTVSYEYKKDVLGAHITGSVYGGGNLANVGYLDDDTKEDDPNSTYKNSSVNICAAYDEEAAVYKAVAFGVNDVTIAGSVFGGGNGAANSFKCEKAMVVGNTNVRIGNGTVWGDVFGGGKVGRVEKSTAVTIGLIPQGVGTSAPVISGYVYGAGQGVATHGYSGLTRGNSTVTIQQNAKVGHSVYGAGQMASLGRYNVAKDQTEADAHSVEVGMPYGLISGGKSTVVIQGNAEIGPNDMTMPTFDGNVFGAGKGVLAYTDVTEEGPGRYYMGASGYTWESYAGAEKENAYIKYTKTLGITQAADVTIAGNAFIKGSVYGGSENGHVRDTTLVKIQGTCQIGNGSGTGKNARFDWSTETPANFSECASWDYGKAASAEKKYQSYDRYQNPTADDGHTFYGNVFGGGSGYFPYKSGKWNPDAGVVGGSTKVLITGGHILTSIYGGNEMTDVNGDSCVVIMTGGTLGVPRTVVDMKAHPVTCYLFGGGKGDPHTFFNDWTNVKNTRVFVGGTARIFGSVFGGAEDGHVSGNAKVQIYGGTIGTTGTSYVDGNIFGGGRGFTGISLRAGGIGGNVDIDITGGTMLGSIYGGGRLASVGVDFGSVQDANSGQFSETGGKVKINISGGTIGNDDPDELATVAAYGHTTGGNVFGGSMGRLTYGGAEFGTTRDSTNVTVGGTRNELTGLVAASGSPVINGHVYGGGYGSSISDTDYNSDIVAGTGVDAVTYRFTPMQYAGIVGGDTHVSVVGSAQVKGNVYGGGEMASVGVIDYSVDGSGKYKTAIKHDTYDNAKSTFYDFGLSWPYKFEYVPTLKDGESSYRAGGKTTVNILGNAIVDNYVFGGGKGKVSFGADGDGKDNMDTQRYLEAHIANVREAEITIGNGSDTPQLRTVYGGGEDGHVMEDASITINSGTVARSVFGSGKGTSKFKTVLWDSDAAEGTPKATTDSVCSWTAGRVYGNTSITINNGTVGWFVYGGGNMASVGKGSYSGGTDDYSTGGYGELPPKNNDGTEGALWTNADFMNSGIATVTIKGGTIGSTTVADENGIPHGSVFGGSRGKAAMSVNKSPRYRYMPDFFMGYVNKAVVNIGGYIDGVDTTFVDGDGPILYGTLYGGGQDGHIRNSTEVRIFKGSIPGKEGDYRSGNVFGAGSGVGTFEDGGNYYCNSSSGSVTCTSLVDVLGGTIAGSVYGGGALASVGPRKTGQAYNEYNNTSDLYPGNKAHGSMCLNKVTIQGGTITGSVYGASRGPAAEFLASTFTSGVSTTESAASYYNPEKYATSIWTEVTVKNRYNGSGVLVSSPTILGNVYGGGEMGQVKESTVVSLTGGTIAHDAYGGGQGTRGTNAIEANVGGNTTVLLNQGKGAGDNGCMVEKIFGCNDQNGTPKGHALVHVYATQHKGTTKIVPDGGKYAKFKSMEGGYTISNYTDNTNADDLKKLATTVGLTSDEITAYETAISSAVGADAQKVSINNYIEAIADKKYDVLAVYGGGDLAMYDPTDPNENTEVIIDGCDLTSIKQVYGGGNAASTPANLVKINAAYEIHEAFGGGNGKDDYEIDGKYYKNLGANVGYKATYYSDVSDDPAIGTKANPYPAVAYENADTPEERRANTSYHYGKGTVELNVTGGRIHTTYGGSNTRGNIRKSVVTNSEDAGICTLAIDKSYPAGKNADTDGEAKLNGSCVDYQAAIYGGAENANVYSDVVIDITNGTYGKIFGGNDRSGKIYGSITINIHESGCKPIIIGELYGGGNEADYSIYGFNIDNSARTKAEYNALSTEEKAQITVQRDPQINIISATRIGKIYGGGYNAKVIGSPSVNVNMEKGFVTAKYVTAKPSDFTEGLHEVTDNGMDASYYVEGLEDGKAILKTGTIGSIYGGGYQGDIQGDTHVEIGTGEWLNAAGERETITPARKSAAILGSVFGGGEGQAPETGDDAFTCEKAMVGVVDSGEGSTSVIIGNALVKGDVYGGGKIGRVESNTSVTIGIENNTTDTITVKGSVYGAGQGVETHGYSGLTRGNSTVIVQGKAKVLGSVYGGGEMATVGRYWVNTTSATPGAPVVPAGTPTGFPYALRSGGLCTVTIRDDAEIGPDDMIMTKVGGPDNTGHVFGAGKGVIAGDYTYTNNENKPWHIDGTGTKVWSADETAYLGFIETLGLASSTNVTISDNAFVKGDVFGGAEQGFVQSNTHVTIEGDCQIGNGYVQMADDGTYLAEPYSLNRRYTTTEWADGRLYKDGETNYTSSLPECASWKYGQAAGTGKYASHDKYANSYDSKGGSTIADNGSTFYGNVFGGGSGYFPYKAGKWHWKAGEVGGNTLVEIKGGHVLTNVYGGNEMTNVEGKATVRMTGGTIGVPRTLGQITAHPVTCYLFGGGKGDPRVLFNKQTNVQDAEVSVTGGWVYGSVFGGGEDGHVMRDVTMTIDGGTTENTPTYADYYEGRATKIGTWGTSYVDGNIFGGGRGFAGDAYTAGNVAGSVTMTISGGEILGSVYGGGRLGSVGYGLYEATETDKYGTMRPDNFADDGTTPVANFKRGYVTMNISGGTIGNTNEFIVPTGNGPVSGTAFGSWTDADWTRWKNDHNVPLTVYDTSNGRVTHTKGGNVYAGGMGRYVQLDGVTPISSYDAGVLTSAIEWTKLGNVKSTKLTIDGDAWIMGNVYGGGEMGKVSGYHTNTTDEKNYGSEIVISNGTIGVEVREGETVQKNTVLLPGTYPTSGNSTVKYTYGSVYGGGMGRDEHDASANQNHGGEVTSNTKVTISGENTKVRASVYGSGEMAFVGGDTYVNISDGEIGRNEVKNLSDPDAGYVLYGGATMGNVYGGGKGSLGHSHTGQVKGNTNVNISGGKVYHMVYGGGALASVGDFKISDGAGNPSYIPIAGIPYDWKYTDGTVINPAAPDAGKTPTGTATVTITGGVIGISGRDNGLVFGSSRGNLTKPVDEDPGEGVKLVDPYDRVAWVNKSVVTIGTEGQGIAAPQPQIKCSVYGGGENGHNDESATVNVYSGTIGITDTDDPWYNFGTNETVRAKAQLSRGNVYGAGNGSDTYTGADGKDYYNPKSGMVAGNTFVNIYGGHIGRSVYGGGAMASVGTITNATDTVGVAKHASETTGFALSWPYKFEFAPNTGKATVNVTGGHIGTRQLDGGDVYGSSRGEAGDRYKMAHLAWTNETEVNVNYPTTIVLTSVADIQNDFTKQCISGSVHGSGENGYVYGDTKVTLNEGLIGHSLYGAGKGKGKYKQRLLKIGVDPAKNPKEENDYYDAEIYSLIAGKVMGNTVVTMNGGRVGRNVYGGGNMGSVGKGNYAGGEDDYTYDSELVGRVMGYGEKINGPLWTENPDANTDAWYFQNSGKTTVKVLGGIVGYIDEADPTASMKNELPYGNVFGGSAGEAAPNVADDPSHLYLYSPAYFSGYVNETDVTIGKTRSDFATDEAYNTYVESGAPKIYASVYGGGQDGHVRRDTKVTVNNGEIGKPYNSDNQTILGNLQRGDGSLNPQWLHRGNVYGGGSGITMYSADIEKMYAAGYTGDKIPASYYSTSSGSVTRFTEVNVLGGIVHRNVYGGGSLGSVGAPNMGQTYDPYKPGQANIPEKPENGPGRQSLNIVNISGQIGTVVNSRAHYGGDVFGAGRGNPSLDAEQFGTSIWTQVNILNGATIFGNVFGGGDAGVVKKNAEVVIGDE